MDSHWDALEADFARFYRLDLRCCLWGPDAFGVRRLWSLVTNLPTEAASAEGWTRTDQLLGLIAETVHVTASGKYLKDAKPLDVLPREKKKAVRPSEVAKQLRG